MQANGSAEKRVLFTGNGGYVADDLMKHVPPEYRVEKCPAIENSFLDALHRFGPQTIVVCLSYESRETLQMLSKLGESREYCNLPIIAIGNEEDCLLFRKNVFQAKMEVLVRPLVIPQVLETLDRFLEERLEELQKVREPQEEEPGPQISDDREEPLSDYSEAEKALIHRIEREACLQGRKTILVVDDDVRMLNIIKLYLQDLYNVVVVPSGKLALKYLNKKSADLVLLDFMMPEEDGPEVLRQIRTNSPQPEIPVLFLTGVADKESVLRGLEYHPNGYMLKPVKRETLLEKATEILLGL